MKFIKYSLVFVCIIFHGTGLSQPTLQAMHKKQQLQKKIQDRIKVSGIARKKIGIVVSDVLSSSHRTVLSINGSKLFTPASLSKIVTSSAVFHYLDPFQQFETSVFAKAPITKGRIKGALYIKGGGDPSFTSETLWNLVNQLTRSGLKIIEGPLILDDSLFDVSTIKKKWMFKVDRSFNALVSALSFNWNSVNIYIRPGRKLMDPVQVYLDPENSFLKLKNFSMTKGKKKQLQVQRIKSRHEDKGDIVWVEGSLPLDHKEFVLYKNISTPTLWTGHQVMEFLKRRGISVKGGIKKGTTPRSAKLIASEKGRTVLRLVQDMMKFSSNFIADTLTFQLALVGGKKIGLWWKGMGQIRKYLKELDIDRYVFPSPSGLSRQNKLAPRDILKILIRDINSAYAFEKVSAYSLGGGDGTLKLRFKDLDHPAMIRGKTGWLNKVVGLAGYVMNMRGDKRAFVFMYNGSTQEQVKAQQLFDDLAAILTSIQ